MKNLYLALILITLFSCDKKETLKPGELHLTGKIEELKKGTIFIQKYKDTGFVIQDSIIFNGSDVFDTKINITEPQMISLYLDRGQTESTDNSLQFFAEPGEMTLNTTLKTFFANATVTGSKNQKKMEEFLAIKNQFTNQDLDLIANEYKLKTPQEKAENQAKRDKITKRKYLYTINFAKNNAAFEIGPYLALKEIPDANPVYLDTIKNAMNAKVAKSIYGKQLNKYIESLK